MRLYFDETIMDWVWMKEDPIIYDDYFWMSIYDLIGEWDHVQCCH